DRSAGRPVAAIRANHRGFHARAAAAASSQMNDQKNTLLAIVLSALVLIGWQIFVGMPQLEKQKQTQQQQQQTQQVPGTPGRTPSQQPGAPPAPGATPQPPGAVPGQTMTREA